MQPERRPVFDSETLELFSRLEHMPPSTRSGPEFKVGERMLARKLNLVDEWWLGSSVLDRSLGPCYPPGHFAHKDWYRVRAVRCALLEALSPATSIRSGGAG
jgi:hypothetical protein